jgi:putative oxidoreductase
MFKIEEYSDSVYVVVRVVIGILFLMHGAMKFASGMPTGLMLAAGIIEVVGGLLVATGLFTKYAAAVSAVEMIAAFIIGHTSKGFNPLTNGGELAIMYLLVFLLFATQGSGKLSLEKAIFK